MGSYDIEGLQEDRKGVEAMNHNDITLDMFELAYRRYHDVGGHTSPDQFSIFFSWDRFKHDPDALDEGGKFAWLKPFLPGGKEYDNWRRD
jgi:hypothetical protein